jgi:predicted RNase H-like nuclease (RuvC/YqgF family)
LHNNRINSDWELRCAPFPAGYAERWEENKMINLLKPLHDLFEKVVVEHGSAVIQERHVSLLKTELSVLEKKIIVLETENRELKAENQKLKLENATKDKKMEILEKRIEKIKTIRNKSDPKWKAFT